MAYVRACGGDVAEWKARWRELGSRLAAERARSSRPLLASPPDQVHDPRQPVADGRMSADGLATARDEPHVRRAENRVLSLARRWPPWLLAGSQDLVLEQLAMAVAAQWSSEAEVRGLTYPLPLPVRWLVAGHEQMDHLFNVTGGSARLAADRLGSLCGHLPQIADIFERIPSRRLVVLGEPGAGKTVLAIQLVRDLLLRRKRGQPVPVLLPIGSWDPRTEHLHSWMAGQLQRMYPLLLTPVGIPGTTVALQFVRTGRVLPVLDGLDEMAAGLRAAAIRGINRACAPTEPLVLTCRPGEYRNTVIPDADASAAVADPPVPALEPLAAAVVAELCPLRRDDIQAYLQEATPAYAMAKWAVVFAHLAAQPRGPLAQALSTPLMTSLARTVYCETTADPVELLDPRFASRVRVEEHLIDRLIPSVYPSHPRPAGQRLGWTVEQATSSLGFLARHLNRLGTRDLAWWQLHSAVPPRRFSMLYGVTAGLAVGVAALLVDAVTGKLADGPVGGLRDATFGLMFGLAAGLTARACDGTVASSARVRCQAFRRLCGGLAGGMCAGLVYGLADVAADGLSRGLAFGVADGALVGLAVGLSAALADGTSPARLQVRLRPRLRYLTRPLLVGIVFGLALGLIGGIAVGWTVGFAGALLCGLASGIVISLRDGFVVPTDLAHAASPSSVLRADQATALVHGLVSGLLGAFAIGFVAVLVIRSSAAPLFGLIFGLVYALASVCSTAWYRFTIARLYLRLWGPLPRRLIAFLADAHQHGLLRQAGGVYQFRHACLQDSLAGGPPLQPMHAPTAEVRA